MEEWRQIKYAPDGYFVSSTGKVRVVKKGSETIKHGTIAKNGYLVCNAHGHCYIHRLVADHFVLKPKCIERLCVNHKDGNKLNNHALNLEWVTYKRNNEHAFEIGIRKTHSENHWASIDKSIVHKIYELKKLGKNSREIAEIVNIKHGTVKAIYSGRSWGYEFKEAFGHGQIKGRGGERSWNSIPKEKVMTIYEMKRAGKRIFEIANVLGLKFDTVKQIFHGHNWKALYKEHFVNG